MKKWYLLFFAVFLACPFAGIAQSDSVKRKADSSLNIKLDDQFSRMQQLSAERLADSLTRANLEKQVDGLTVANNKKRLSLNKELNWLRERDSSRRVQQIHQIDSLRKFVKGFPVIFFRDTLFFIYTRQGSFLPKERAAAISARISKLGDDYSFRANSLKVSASEQTSDLFYKDILIASVSEQDALWANTTKEKLAENLKVEITKAIVSYKKETSLQTLVKQGLLALLVIVIVSLIIYGIHRLFKWARAKTTTKDAWYTRGIKIKGFELLNGSRQLKLLHSLINVVKWLFIVLVVYLALPVLFGIFPFTRDISNTLLGYVISPLKRIAIAVWEYIPNLITIIIVVVIFRYILKFFRFIKLEIEEGRLSLPGFYADWANPTFQILRVLILAFMLVIIFPYLPGSDSGIFKGVSVFIGVLFTFGSAGALGNIVAGLVLTYMRAFKLGDRVKIGEVTGDIIAKTLLVTRIRTIQNEIISIPNSTVMSNHTLNYSSDAAINGLILHTSVTIGYDSPWRQVHELLIAAALETPMIETEPKPYVYQTSLDDYYVSYRINSFTKEPNKQAAIYSDLHQNIQDQFNKAGVEIMSPHYKSLRDGNATTIPPEYLPKDYVAPTFNTKQNNEKCI